MKTTLILYGATEKLSNAHKLVTVPHLQGLYYVRAELSPYDVGEAMLHAKPQPGEMLINTVEYEHTRKKLWNQKAA